MGAVMNMIEYCRIGLSLLSENILFNYIIFISAITVRNNHTELVFDLGPDIYDMILDRSYVAIPHSGSQLVCIIPPGPHPITCREQDEFSMRGYVVASGQPLRRMPSGFPTYSLFCFRTMASKLRNQRLVIRLQCVRQSCQSAWRHKSYFAFLKQNESRFQPGCQSSTPMEKRDQA